MAWLAPEVLTPRERRFVEEYLIDLHAGRAAQRAGYGEANPSEVLARPRVQDALALAFAKRAQRTSITADKVLDELAKIGFSNMGDYMKCAEDGSPILDFIGLTREQMAALAEVTVVEDYSGKDKVKKTTKFRLHDKLGALVNIGKHLGMFVEKVSLTTTPLDGLDADGLRALDEAVGIIRREAGRASESDPYPPKPVSH